MKKRFYTLRDDINKRLKNPEFRKAWEQSNSTYLLGKSLIEKRMAKNMSQRALAKSAHTTQAVISRIESMSSNPSFNLLKRLADALGTTLKIGFE